VRAGLDTLATGEADYPTEVKARELGINLILVGHRETEILGAMKLMENANFVIGFSRTPRRLLCG
jgi:putative NIF3 family GTP cyclohydrolase 1 type 2